MGADTKKKPPLPAPTESDSTAGVSELATDLSRATDKTSYSIPEDGSPITISTRRKREKEGDGKLTHGSHPSQTSLLIEYFEGGKEGKSDTRRPSVRVRVTPSSHRKSKSTANDHIQITESKGSRKPSYTKRISLNNFKDDQEVYEKSLSEATGSNVTSNGGGPIEIEVAPPRRHGSPLIPDETTQSTHVQQQNGSDVSSMPPFNSFLDGGTSTQSPRRKRSKSLSGGEALAVGAAAGLVTAAAVDNLKAPTSADIRSRSLSQERITQKAIEKIKHDHQSDKRRKQSKSRARSISGEKEPEGSRTPRKRSSRNHNFDDSIISGTDSSLLSSQPAQSQQSFRSGTTKSSINNPKLLETVEDAIRRLILPELRDLKREQSKHGDRRERERRGSITTSSGISRESREERAGTPKVTLNGKEVLDNDSLKRRKEGARDPESSLSSERSFEREASEETITPGRDRKKRTNSERHRGIEALAAGGAIGALTAAALHKHDSKDNLDDTRERRRRRNKGHTTSENVVGKLEEKSMLPMPMMSEINNSEMTRTSIQSASTERPHSASEEQLGTPIHEVRRGQATNYYDSPSPGSPLTPTRTPVGLRQGLGTQHTNYSRGDLSLKSRNSNQQIRGEEFEIDERGRKVPLHRDSGEYDQEDERQIRSHAVEAGLAGAAGGVGLATFDGHNDEGSDTQSPMFYPYGHYTQEVPPPLKYVPYVQENRRGLSPIQSVSSWREDDLDHPSHRDAGLASSVRSYSSVDKQSQQYRESVASYNSLDSSRNAGQTNRHDFAEVREGGLADSELTQDSQDREYWEEQHRFNGREHEMDEASYRDSDTYSDRVHAGQNIRGGAGTNVHVHTPVGVESAVASIVDSSVFTGGSNQSGQSEQHRQVDRKASYASFEEGEERFFTSRGNSPEKRDSHNGIAHKETRSPESSGSSSSPNRYAPEYELDENGRKVTMPSYRRPNLIEIGAIGAAAGVVAGVLSDRKDHNAKQERREHEMESYGTPQNKSFKERAMENIALAQGGSPQRSNGKSIAEEQEDHIPIKMSASGIPNANDPIPEYGYVDDASEVTTNPSIIHGPGGAVTESGLANAMDSQVREPDDRNGEWERSSEERKRDTLVTNPYEESEFGFNNVSSPLGAMKDEGYISSAPNGRSPDVRSPERRPKGVGFLDQEGLGESSGRDPLHTPDHSRHLGGMSEGINSPLYDGATGNGMDRIKNQDIIALMEHLTVRDAQRSARDAEILFTLVRAAAENRNHATDVGSHFEDLKRLLADTEDVIITEVQRNTDKSIQKGIGGSRPQPSSAPRSFRSQDEDGPTKRRNVFKRALKGLGLKSTNDLGRIEDMMMQILTDVEDLKKAQGISQRPQGAGSRADSYNDMQDGAYEQDRGYEPEGHAGTSTASHASQSGHFSNPRSRGTSAVRGFDGRKDFSDHRISTVPEGDEDELDQHEQEILDNQFENNEALSTPTRENPRGGSAPLQTPPQVYIAQASNSTENTPKTDKSKKHKSSSSSGWLPKIRSRWSETTASSVAKGFRSNRSSKQKEDLRPTSKSGSDPGSFDGQENGNNWNYHGSDKLHSGFSQDDMLRNDETESMDGQQEDPKYKAHRNSLNLQHPQPRPHPTHRYQTALEVKAQDFGHPSPKSVDWGSNTSVNRLPQINRYSSGTAANLSPISDGPYSLNSMQGQNQSSSAPPRPPKEPLSSDPEHPPKVRNKLSKPSPLKEQLSNQHLSAEHVDRYSNGNVSPLYDNSMGSPRPTERRPSPLGRVPERKPVGPRSMSTASKSGSELDRDGTVIRKPVNRNTFGTITSQRSGESEIF